MKKICAMIVICLLLCGCGAQETLETISDHWDVSVMAHSQQVQLTLPEEAAIETMLAENADKLYLCDGYTVAVQTVEAGDMDKTLKSATGFGSDELTVMETVQGGIKRFDCVWSAAGEAEDQVCRAAILDDGAYHYVVTLMTGSSMAGELAEVWQEILDSVTLVSTG